MGLHAMYENPILTVDPGMHTAAIQCAAKDAAGHWGVTGSLDKTVRIWSLADGELVRTIRLPTGPERVGMVYDVAMSPDGVLIAAGGWTRWTATDQQQQIYLIDRASGKFVHRIEGLPNVTSDLAFSPDGQSLAAILQTGGLRIYSREENWSEVARDADHPGNLASMAFTESGRLATTAIDGTIRLYSAPLTADLQPTQSIKVPAGLIPTGIAVKPRGLSATINEWARDKKRLAVGFGNDPSVVLLDEDTLFPMYREWAPDLSDVTNGDLGSVAWSTDGEVLFAAGTYAIYSRKAIIAWNYPGGQRRFLPASYNSVRTLKALFPDELLVATADPCFARLREDGYRRWEHSSPKADFRGQCRTLCVSFDGCIVDFHFDRMTNEQMRFDVSSRSLNPKKAEDAKTVAPCMEGLAIENWENLEYPTIGNRSLKLFSIERSHALAIHPTGKSFVLGTDDHLRGYSAEGELLWIRPAPEHVWATNISGDGRLVVAACGDGTIRWHRMTDGVELLAFMPQRDRINWVAWTPEGFYGASAGAHGVLRWHVNRGWDEPADSIAIERIPRLRRPEVLPLVLQELETPRALGLAEIAEARRQIILATNSRLPPGSRLHLLSIGISLHNSEYAAHLRLHYADRDAYDLTSAIVNTQGGLYGQILPQMLRDKEATKAGVLRAFITMRTEIEKSFGNDLAVVHFSGHGALIDGRLYLLPYDVDARSFAGIKYSALSVEELKSELLALAKHGRVLVLVDACHSGATTLEGVGLDTDSTGMRYSLAATNITVVTSSTGKEVSREASSWGHGAFTKVLLDLFNDRDADLDRTGLISVSGLARYIAQRVPALTGGAQNPGMEVRYEGTVFASNC